MIYDFLDKDWLYSYNLNLKLFRDDLNLISKDGFKLYVAIDFHDIFKYCFPFAEFFRIDKKWINTEFQNFFYRSQISRSSMFFMLENIYQKPNILLPPYVDETYVFSPLLVFRKFPSEIN
jgi:hypothetical protein